MKEELNGKKSTDYYKDNYQEELWMPLSGMNTQTKIYYFILK